MSVCASAARLPTIIESAATVHTGIRIAVGGVARQRGVREAREDGERRRLW